VRNLLMMVFLCAATTVAAQDPASFTVGTAKAVRGQKALGAIEVPAGVDAALSIPVAVVHGARPGPVLAIVSGAHGTEYSSIIAVERLIQAIDPASVSGTVILIPLVNVPSFEQKIALSTPSTRRA
jgi:predicted deacylase